LNIIIYLLNFSYPIIKINCRVLYGISYSISLIFEVPAHSYIRHSAIRIFKVIRVYSILYWAFEWRLTLLLSGHDVIADTSRREPCK